MPLTLLYLLVLLSVGCRSSSDEPRDGGSTPDAGAMRDADPSGDANLPDASEPEAGDIARDYCAPLARLVCERAEACGCGTLVPGGALDTAGCTSRWTDKCVTSYAPYVAAVAMGKARVSKPRVERCIALIDTLTPPCERPRGLVSFALCEPFVFSDTPIDEACNDVPICAGGAGLCKEGSCVARGEVDAECNSEFDCATGLGCVSGKCQRPAAATSSCSEDDSCAPPLRCISGACTALRAEGQSCAETNECAQGLACSEKKCTKPTTQCSDDSTCGNRSTCGAPRSCQPRATLDAPCSSDGECAGDLYCGSEGTCIALPGPDAPCANGAACAAELACEPPEVIDPTCQPLPTEGEPCGLTPFGPFACAAGLGCLDSKCGALPGEGKTCTNDNRCGAGLACDFTAEGSFCVVPKSVGEPCQNDVVCGTTGHCAGDGLCAKDLPTGARCDPNFNQCAGVCERDASFGFACVERPGEGGACIFDEECPASLSCRLELAKATCIAEVCEVLR